MRPLCGAAPPPSLPAMKTPLIYGTGMTIAGAVLTLLLHMLGFSTNPEKMLLTMIIVFPSILLITILGIIFSTRAVRAEHGPVAFTYGQAFKTGLLTAIFAGLTGAIFQFAYYKFLFPDFAEVAIQWTRSLMEKMGAPSATVEEKIDEMRVSMTLTRQVLQGFFSAIIFGAIISLITSAFLKRAAPDNLASAPPPPLA